MFRTVSLTVYPLLQAWRGFCPLSVKYDILLERSEGIEPHLSRCNHEWLPLPTLLSLVETVGIKPTSKEYQQSRLPNLVSPSTQIAASPMTVGLAAISFRHPSTDFRVKSKSVDY